MFHLKSIQKAFTCLKIEFRWFLSLTGINMLILKLNYDQKARYLDFAARRNKLNKP